MGSAQKGWGVLEIGAGVGVLTRELALRADKVVSPCLVAKIRQQAAFYNVGQSCSGKKNKSVGSKGEVVCGMEIRRSYADRIPVLEETLADCGNVTVINEDVMKADLSAIIAEHFPKLKVAALTVFLLLRLYW